MRIDVWTKNTATNVGSLLKSDRGVTFFFLNMGIYHDLYIFNVSCCFQLFSPIYSYMDYQRKTLSYIHISYFK